MATFIRHSARRDTCGACILEGKGDLMATTATKGAAAAFVQGALIAGLSSPGLALGELPALPSGGTHRSYQDISPWDRAVLSRRIADWARAGAWTVIPGGTPASRQDFDEHFVVEVLIADEPIARAASAIRSNADIIAAIRSAFSLQVKELAEILKVERPTIYSWIKDQAFPTKQNQGRLQQVYRLATTWNNLSSNPVGKAIREIGLNGTSMLDVLKDDPIDESDVMRRLKSIAADPAKSKLGSRRSFREIAKQRGLDLSEVSEQQDMLDVVTGKRLHQDD